MPKARPRRGADGRCAGAAWCTRRARPPSSRWRPARPLPPRSTRLADAGADVQEVTLPWDIAAIKRAARIHFGMIFGPSMREIYAAHADELTSYARRFLAESDEITKEDLVAGLALEACIYAPLGQLLDDVDALVCPTVG